jgi:hypothetical protein
MLAINLLVPGYGHSHEHHHFSSRHLLPARDRLRSICRKAPRHVQWLLQTSEHAEFQDDDQRAVVQLHDQLV